MTRARKKMAPVIQGDAWLTLLQASRLLGRHRQTVLRLAAAGQLVTDERAGMTFVTRASVDAYLAAQHDPAQRAA